MCNMGTCNCDDHDADDKSLREEHGLPYFDLYIPDVPKAIGFIEGQLPKDWTLWLQKTYSPRPTLDGAVRIGQMDTVGGEHRVLYAIPDSRKCHRFGPDAAKPDNTELQDAEDHTVKALEAVRDTTTDLLMAIATLAEEFRHLVDAQRKARCAE